jgi:hypothetical protein
MFKELGIQIEAAYLDVFAAAEPDECFNEAHPMTRRQCVAYRRECLDSLNARGIIPSSEEIVDAMLPSMALVHHSPFAEQVIDGKKETYGIAIPLVNLVYHDAVVTPWIEVEPGALGGWGMAHNDSPYLWALLCGGTIYLAPDADAETIERIKPVLEFHKKVALSEMLRHEFIDGDTRRHRAIYANGSVVEVNFDTQEYKIETSQDR